MSATNFLRRGTTTRRILALFIAGLTPLLVSVLGAAVYEAANPALGWVTTGVISLYGGALAGVLFIGGDTS